MLGNYWGQLESIDENWNVITLDECDRCSSEDIHGQTKSSRSVVLSKLSCSIFVFNIQSWSCLQWRKSGLEGIGDLPDTWWI